MRLSIAAATAEVMSSGESPPDLIWAADTWSRITEARSFPLAA